MSATPLPTHLTLWQQTLSWQPTLEQQALFQKLYEQILDGNTRLNLTRITEPEEFWEKHLWDSVSGLAPWLTDEPDADDADDADDAEKTGRTEPEDAGKPDADAEDADSEDVDSEDVDSEDVEEGPIRIVDIGTGGGFPGLPAAIALAPITGPIDLTLVDSTRKKIFFLQELCQQLQLKSFGINANCLAIRAETLGQQAAHRETYDLALVRAVGSTLTCAEYVLPLLQIDGQAVLFRGQWSNAETEALLPVLDVLGGELTDLQRWETPITKSVRHCLFIHKVAPTPNALPRAVGIPSKTPLA